MKRSVCGIMNSGIGGSIWLGVSHQAVVEGFKITRAQVYLKQLKGDYYMFCFAFCFVEGRLLCANRWSNEL